MNSKLWLYKAEMDLTSYSMTLLMAAQQQLHAMLEKNTPTMSTRKLKLRQILLHHSMEFDGIHNSLSFCYTID